MSILRRSVPDLSAAAFFAVASPALAADYSAIHGHWQTLNVPCGTFDDQSIIIDRHGASFFESTCKILSANRKGRGYSLKQRCEYFENEVETTVLVLELRGKYLHIGNEKYHRCGR